MSRNRGIRARLIFVYFFISIIPMLLITICIFSVSSVSFSRQVGLLIDNELTQVRKNIESHLRAYRYLLIQSFGDESLTTLMESFESSGAPHRAAIKSTMRKRFFSLAFNMDEIQAVTFIWPSLDTVSFVKGIETVNDTPFTSAEVSEKFFDVATRRRSGVIISTMPVAFARPDISDKYFFHFVFPYYDLVDRHLIGVLALSIDEKALAGICAGMKNSITFIMNSGGSIVSFEPRAFIGKEVPRFNASIAEHDPKEAQKALADFVAGTRIFKSRRILVQYCSMSDPEWIIVNAADHDSFFRDTKTLQAVSFLAMAGLIVVSLSAIVAFSKGISSAVTALVAAMGFAQEGNLVKVSDIDRRDDEFGILARGYNVMIDEIRGLMSNLQREKDSVLLATQKQKEYELRALEAQINPHFLYNTLDCINWMAIEKNEYAISEMLAMLGQILRYSISKSDGIVTVAQELEWVLKYVYIQRIRFNKVFDLELDADPAVSDFPIYKLLMQPFIENAIVHGFADTSSGGLLRIWIRGCDDGRLAIDIRDNGKGIDAETLHAAINDASSHIGVANALDRIRAYYGERASVEIRNEPCSGVLVAIIIPRP